MSVHRYIRGAILLAAWPVCSLHATIFDFGNGDIDGNTGVAANFGVSEGANLAVDRSATVDGITLTLAGMATPPGGSTWGANSQGIGIYTMGQSGTTDRRIRSADGESVTLHVDR
ncbi:MAG: hypothetical protein AAF492_31200, partial [Verrucomicrobiota bacterium]